jgi:hypothetical protein
MPASSAGITRATVTLAGRLCPRLEAVGEHGEHVARLEDQLNQGDHVHGARLVSGCDVT